MTRFTYEDHHLTSIEWRLPPFSSPEDGRWVVVAKLNAPGRATAYVRAITFTAEEVAMADREKLAFTRSRILEIANARVRTTEHKFIDPDSEE